MIRIVLVLFIFLSFRNHSQVKEFNIISLMNGTFTTEDGTTMPFWGFGEQVPGAQDRASLPGPLLEVELGDSVIIHFSNPSPEDHTIHLHGLDVNQVNDGVPATSVSVPNNGSYDYHWKATHVGSFLYHCHVQTIMHSSLGMYGMIVVKNSPNINLLSDNGPGFNKDYNFLFSEMYTAWNLNPLSPGPFHLFDPDYFMVNGKSSDQILNEEDMVIDAQLGDSIFLRFANIAFSKVKLTFPEGLNPIVYTSDGRLIPQPMDVDTLLIYAGERYGVMLYPDQYIEDFIEVEYLRMYEDEFEGENQIAVNMNFSGLDDEFSLKTMKVHPNPAVNYLRIEEANVVGDIELYDIQGRSIKKEIINGKIDVSDLESGLYVLRFLKNENQITSKFIKQ